MIRLNRLCYLQRAMEATDRGEWYDLGRATHGLRLWFRKHGFVEPRPTSDPAWPSWRYVKVTDKGRAALAEAKKEYARHSNPTRAEQRRFAALKGELADAFGFNEERSIPVHESSWEPGVWAGEWWPWQDWLAEQWGARSFRFRVLAERSCEP